VNAAAPVLSDADIVAARACAENVHPLDPDALGRLARIAGPAYREAREGPAAA
jgi:hypothetical protein